MRRYGWHHIGFFLFLLLLSCQPKPRQGETVDQKQNIEDAKTALEKANRYLVRKEREDIENYERRHGLQMKETGSGLRYQIYKKGDGKKAATGEVAVMNYTLSLLSGDIVYSSKKDGPKIFEIGRGNVESGLEEAVLMMHVGDKALLILPAHLGYGLLGDDKKIPPRCTLIYNVELVDLK